MCKLCSDLGVDHETLAKAIGDAIKDRRYVMWKVFDERVAEDEKRFKEKLISMFERQRDEMMALVNKAPDINYYSAKAISDVTEFDWDKWIEEFNTEFQTIYATTAQAAGDAAAAQVGANIAFDFEDPAVQEFIGFKTRTFSEDINATTMDKIDDVLRQGAAEGLGPREVGRRIGDVFDDAIGWRGEMIARTEMIASNNASASIAYQQAGVKRREWLSTPDARTRADHVDADGQIVGVDQSFDVGGEQLMYPGDPAGSGQNTINCRCTIAPIVI